MGAVELVELGPELAAEAGSLEDEEVAVLEFGLGILPL